MAIVHDNFSNFSNRVFMGQVISRLIAAIPGGLVIHQNLNLRFMRRSLDGARILATDG